MTLKLTSEPVFHYFNSEWVPLAASPPKKPIPSELTLGCYNVLFPSKDPIRSLITSDRDRYKYQIEDLIPKMNIDILALSEVKDVYINTLLKINWIRKNYFVYNCEKTVFRQFFGNIILSKYPMKCYTMDNLIYGRVAVALLKFQEKLPFLVLSVHLTAFEKNYNIRKRQLSQIIQALNEYSNKNDPFYDDFREAVSNKNVIIMGDLNFHLKRENSLVYELKLIDLWTETQNEEGFSWDAQNNSLTNFMLPFDNRRMRLDRIFFLEGSKLFWTIPSEKMELFGREKVFPNKNFSFLMGSDHFGLKVKIALKENFDGYSRKNAGIMKEFEKDTETHFRSEETILIYRCLSVLVIIIVLVLVIILLLF